MLRPLLLIAALSACNPAPVRVAQVEQTDAPQDTGPTEQELKRAAYKTTRETLHTRRLELAAKLDGDREATLIEAREVLLTTLTAELIPAWHGTPWNFYGTSEIPGRGKIACGYYVSTLLQHADLDVERIRLAQQPSEHIVRTFTAGGDIRRFRNRPAQDVIDEVERQGEGLYVLGLDYHAALLWNDGERVRMCHSSYLGTGAATCEDALTSPAMISKYRVIGKLLDDRMVEGWLRGRSFDTWTG